MQCGAVPCRAVRCCAVACCGVFCCAFSFVRTRRQRYNSKQTELARGSMSSSILYSIVIEAAFSTFCFRGPCCILYRCRAAVLVACTTRVCCRLISTAVPRAQQSSASQHRTAQSPLHEAAKNARADQSTCEESTRFVRTLSLIHI